MFSLGIFLLVIASFLRGWGVLNHHRGPAEKALIFNNPLFEVSISVGSLVLGLVASVCVEIATTVAGGATLFVLFLLFSGVIWMPVLTVFGL